MKSCELRRGLLKTLATDPKKSKEGEPDKSLPSLPAREAWARNTQLPTTDRPMSRTLASCNAEPTTGQSSSRPMSRT